MRHILGVILVVGVLNDVDAKCCTNGSQDVGIARDSCCIVDLESAISLAAIVTADVEEAVAFRKYSAHGLVTMRRSLILPPLK